MNIGFIGLGRMGSGMARNLLRAGNAVAVYNRSREKAEPLAADGALIATSPADACKNAEAVMTMVADDMALEHIVFGESGIAEALPAGCIHVSHSTISTALARKLTAEHASRKQGFVSAPVFGRPEAAEAKRLVVLAGGLAAEIERCKPLLESIGRALFVVGAEPWQANVTKLCGNFMILSVIEVFGEANATLRKAGVAPQTYLEIIDTLMGSTVISNYGRVIANQAFEPAGFALKLGLKDARLIMAAAEEAAVPMPLASLLHDHMLAGVAQGMGEIDWSGMTQVVARNAGL